MPNVAVVLREEIRRLARREIKAQVGSTRQAVAAYRREIAKLKRQLNDQSRKIAALQHGAASISSQGEADEADPLNGVRFSSRSVRAQRQRLGISAADYAKLIGVSALTIYSWESGKSRPRKSQLAALVAVRNIGRREALRRLGELGDKPRRRRATA